MFIFLKIPKFYLLFTNRVKLCTFVDLGLASKKMPQIHRLKMILKLVNLWQNLTDFGNPTWQTFSLQSISMDFQSEVV